VVRVDRDAGAEGNGSVVVSKGRSEKLTDHPDRRSLMRQSIKLLTPMLAAAVLLAACGSSSKSSTGTTSAAATAATQAASSQSAAGSAAVVKTASNSTLGGTILVNAKGMTLYHLSGEQNGKFICTSSACVGVWHPLTVPAGSTPAGVSSLATVKRPDGAVQITYKGMPLYTFAQDTSTGQANGQGMKDVGTWSAVTVSGEGGAASTPSGSKGASPGGEGGGYGY
jgi:predicted lipoprotein with Yx(FWY)xxD motif